MQGRNVGYIVARSRHAFATYDSAKNLLYVLHMRKLAWLTLFAAAVLFFSAPESAFAHPSHHHTQQTQTAPVLKFETAAPVVEQILHFDEFVSAAQSQPDTCPHGQGADCNFCCACAGAASVALATPDVIGREVRAVSGAIPLAASYLLPQTVFDLSRPPKSFA